jgi:hypothetical protein
MRRREDGIHFRPARNQIKKGSRAGLPAWETTRTMRTTTAATHWRWRKGTSGGPEPRERPRRKCAGARTEFISGPQEIKSKRACGPARCDARRWRKGTSFRVARRGSGPGANAPARGRNSFPARKKSNQKGLPCGPARMGNHADNEKQQPLRRAGGGGKGQVFKIKRGSGRGSGPGANAPARGRNSFPARKKSNQKGLPCGPARMGNHADNENNNRCDALAVAERDKFSK